MRVALIQMNSRDNPEANRQKAAALIDQAAAGGAELVVLPELFTYLGPDEGARKAAEPIPGPTSAMLGERASRHRIYLLGGSIIERAATPGRAHNTSLLYDPSGACLATYRKIHLFDVNFPDLPVYRESAVMEAGRDVVVADTAFGRVGLSVCYDLRFPELYRALAARGAEVVFVPAAFTMHTGKDHWEILVRARAIENQAFVLAAAQVGTHPPGKVCYGNSLVVDPWGTVIARADDAETILLAELDLAYQKRVRRELPALGHRRPDLFRD